MSNWQPIETAPKDGTKIIVYPHITTTYWVDDLDEDGEKQIVKRRSNPEHNWVDHFSEYWEMLEVLTVLPTHWMKLPEPPKDISDGT